MLDKCRNDEPKDGYDSRKIESVMACFGRGVEKHPPPCSLHTVLQAAENRVNAIYIYSFQNKVRR